METKANSALSLQSLKTTDLRFGQSPTTFLMTQQPYPIPRPTSAFRQRAPRGQRILGGKNPKPSLRGVTHGV